jgi:phage repressor protein C with HTH and peptisase S24 domain
MSKKRKKAVAPDSPLKAARKSAKLSLEGLAQKVSSSRQQMQRLEKGLRGLSREWAVRLAPHLNVRPETLMFGQGMAQAAGHIGAGGEVIPFDDFALGAGLEEVEIPAGVPLDAVLVIVRGDSMYPRYFDGEYLFYVRNSHAPSDLVGRECVVKLSDGRIFVKILRRGSEASLFNLESWNSSTPTMEDQVEWAAPVVSRVNKMANRMS